MAKLKALPFTQIPNEVLESILAGRFNKRELLILIYVFRNGYGFGKDSSEVRLKPDDLAGKTNIHRSDIWKTLHGLERRNVLKLTADSILFNSHAYEWFIGKTPTAPKVKHLQFIGKTPTAPKVKHLQFIGKTPTVHRQNTYEKTCNPLTDSDLQTPKETFKETFKENPHTPKGGLHENSFNRIWQFYPKKVGKKAALRAWEKLEPSIELIATVEMAIKKQSKTKDWQKDDGKYIPHLSTWISQERWEDELPQEPEYGYGLAPCETGLVGYGLP